jgi:hypothetical protein
MFLISKPFLCVIEPTVQMYDLYLKSFEIVSFSKKISQKKT